ncbi:MAG: hypothetical protein IKP66_00175 [Lachnospiraceae bacterium]|nr:hypothetical protein [Lachnospiraceae bacterium]
MSSANEIKICLQCGRSFRASNNKHPFCSVNCKMRYANHRGFNCKECRNASCTVRNEDSIRISDECPNYKWTY